MADADGEWWAVTTYRFTVAIKLGDTLLDGPPIMGRFMGQPRGVVIAYLTRLGARWARLED